MLTRCNLLWIGAALGFVERACILSVLRQGHPVTLYCYEEPAGVPSGVQLADAATVLPAEKIIYHARGSVALFSDWFRYELQRRGAGIWLDCDAYLLAPLEDRAPYLMGEFEPGHIATGILRIPTDSPILPILLALFEEKSVPPWLPLRSRLAARFRLLTTGRSVISSMPWGSLGPDALSALARAEGIAKFAMPSDVFYPVHWRNADWIRNPNVKIEQVITSRTVSLHLWNECTKAYKNLPAETGSFLDLLQRESEGDRRAAL